METNGETKKASPPWDCGSPLYDAFELASLYRVLDSHLMALPFPARDGGERAAHVAVAAASRRARSWRRRRVVKRRGGRQGRAALHLQDRHLQQEAVAVQHSSVRVALV
jgi:hypothetical protein